MEHTHTLAVAAGHEQQLAAWDGDEGDFWAEHAVRFDESITPHHQALMAALDLEPDSRALDVGCGTGLVTRDVARRTPRGWVLGVDLSARMLDVARTLATSEQLGNVDFDQVDAQIHPFRASEYDLVVSRTAAMFFADKQAAFDNLSRAMQPDGQMVLLVWQEPARNEWFLAFGSALAAGRDLPMPPPEGPHPFSLSDPDVTTRLLEGAGLHDVHIDPVEAPMYFGADADEAYRFVSEMLEWMIAGVDEAARASALRALHQTMEEHTASDGVTFGSAAWLVTARR